MIRILIYIIIVITLFFPSFAMAQKLPPNSIEVDSLAIELMRLQQTQSEIIHDLGFGWGGPFSDLDVTPDYQVQKRQEKSYDLMNVQKNLFEKQTDALVNLVEIINSLDNRIQKLEDKLNNNE